MQVYLKKLQVSHQRTLNYNRKENGMKIHELDTREIRIAILNEKVFQLDSCPFWAQYAAVDEDGKAYWYAVEPYIYRTCWCANPTDVIAERIPGNMLFDPTDWKHSLIKRPERKALEVTMTELEKKCGCKIKIVKED